MSIRQEHRMLALALLAFGGAWAGAMLPLRPAIAYALAAASAGIVVAGRERARLVLPAVAVAFAALAAGSAGALRDGPLVELAGRGGAAHVEASVVSEARASERGWWTVVRIEELDGRPTRQRALWVGHGEPPPLGGRYAGTVTARPLSPSSRHLRWSHHVAARVDVVGWARTGDPGPLASSTTWVRARLRAMAAAALPPAHAGLAAGLVTGDTSLLPRVAEEDLRRAGLTHLVAVSGSNVALVVSGWLGLSALLGVPARARHLSTALLVVAFAYLTRWEPSVLRASAAALVLLVARWRGVAVVAPSTLAAAVLTVLAFDPLLARALGFQLSVAATLGIVLLMPVLAARWPRVPLVLRVTVAAQAGVAPVLLAVGGDVPVASLPANVVAVPAAAAASVLATAAAIVGLVAPPVGLPLLWAARIPLGLVLAVAGAAARAGPAASSTLVAGVALAGGAALLATSRPTRVAVAMVALLGVAIGRSGPTAPAGLRVVAIDVGQGDAVIVEAPGVRLLVDGGPDRSAVDHLRRTGRDRVDLAVLTHPDADHLDGLAHVLDDVVVGELWAAPAPDDHRADALIADALAEGVSVHRPIAGERARLGGLTVEVLHPPAGSPYGWSDREGNELSIVLRVTWSGRSVLLTGDVEGHAQRDLMARSHALRADVLKVPHHGSRTSLPEFLTAVGAATSIISAGRDNAFGHPHPDIVEVLEALGSVRRTDVEGTITIVLPSATADGPSPEGVVSPPSIGSGHGHRTRVLHRRRRRSPPAAGVRTGARGPSCVRARPRRRASRRRGGR